MNLRLCRSWRGRALALVSLVFLAGADCAEGHPDFDAEVSAGPHQTVRVGETAHLQGSINATQYTIEWSMSASPAGSHARLVGPIDQLEASFVPDLPGAYGFRFQVEALKSYRDYTQVTALPAVVADAGADLEGSVGELIVLEGTGAGAEGDEPLSFAWSFVHRPAGSSATLVDADQAQASFVADVAGTFELRLTVNDGFGESSDTVRVSIGSGIPVHAIHVAPGGDDTAAGATDSPLATIGEAFARIAADAEINRVQVAAGVYEEAFGIALATRAVEVVGPEAAGESAVLRAAGPFFTVTGDAALTLRRLSLVSEGSALTANGGESSLSLIDVECTAMTCVESGGMPEEWDGDPTGPGGTVLVEGSTFVGGSGDGAGSGIRVADAPGVTVLDTTITGFGLAIVDHGSKLVIRRGRITGAGTALSIRDIPSAGEGLVLISEARFEDNASAIAIESSSGITIEDSLFVGIQGRAIDVRGTEVRIDGSSFEEVDECIHVADGSVPGRVVVRNATSDAAGTHAIRILAGDTAVDLGNELEPGGNIFASSQIPLVDERPANSTGLVTISGTSLNGVEPTPGTYEGPHDGTAQGFSIENEGNQLIAY